MADPPRFPAPGLPWPARPRVVFAREPPAPLPEAPSPTPATPADNVANERLLERSAREAIDYLRGRVKDPDPKVAIEAARVLGTMWSRRDPLPPETTTDVEAVKAALRSPEITALLREAGAILPEGWERTP